MTIEHFTRAEFESALPTHCKTGEPLWEYSGFDLGEHVYFIPVKDTNKRIFIRSSIGVNGKSAESGENSIRLWVSFFYTKADKWIALAKLDKWTTRLPGWQERVTSKLRELYKLALEDSRNHNHTVPSQAKVVESVSDAPALPLGKAVSLPTEGTDECLNHVQGVIQPCSVIAKQQDGTTTSVPSVDVTTSGIESRESGTILPLGETVTLPTDSESVIPRPMPTRTPNVVQLAAITAPVNAAVRVLAGPGSGKTTVLEERIAYLLANGAQPQDILAVTFSKPMATEMQSRIFSRSPELVGTAAERQICTIHALCYRLLKADGDKRRVAKEWQIKKAIQETAEDLWRFIDERPGYKEIYLWINNAKFAGLLVAEDLSFFTEQLGDYQGRKLHEARLRFDRAMQRENLITFPDMLFDVEVKLNRDKSFREKWQARFKWVLVDESQDTSSQAMQVLATLAEPQNQIVLAGDIDQNLYKFAGATPEANLFEGFESRYGEQEPFKLVVNYRSTHEIVEAENRLIAFNYTDSGGPYDEKYRKTLVPRPDAPQGEPITFDWYESVEDEAQALADSLVELLIGDRQPGDVFVGARTRAQLGYLEGPLVRAKLPFVNITGGSFWTSKHTLDVVAYVRLAHDTTDDAAFKRVYNIGSNWMTVPWKNSRQYGEYCNHRFLGRAFMSACQGKYANVWTVGQQKRFKPGVENLISFVRDMQPITKPAEAVKFVVDHCYRKYLRHEEGLTATDEAENGKLEDLATVADIASKFATIPEFLAHIDEMVAAAEAVRDKDWGDFIVLSTLHRLKGLERKVVYGVGWCEGHDQVSHLPRGLLPHTFSLVAPPQNGILPTGGRGRVADEICCGYVLISRAQDEVHLSGCAKYRTAIMHPSRFIEMMGLGEG